MDPAQVIMEEALVRQRPILEAATRGDSEIQRFFSGTTVLVTGGTGYLGKLLIEKLIRACNVEKIFVILRAKKGKSIKERMDILVKDNVFDTLRIIKPDYYTKIEPIEGDVSELKLGLNIQDWMILVEKVDVIFHMAATTRFDETLQRATMINVRGTREVVTLAKQCKKLRSFVYVSTAYSQATREKVNSDMLEQFSPSPIAPDALIAMAESMENDRLVSITKQLIEGWPNTYTFTKAVAEEFIRTNMEHLPACVVRPPIVLGAYFEPTPGWNDPTTVYGATGVVLETFGGGLCSAKDVQCSGCPLAGGDDLVISIPWFLTVMLGVAHVSLMSNIRCCVAQGDYVINAVIASSPESSRRHNESEKELKIYNISSGLTFNMGTASRHLRTPKCRSLVSPKSVWYCWTLETGNKFIYWVLFWLLHYVPAYLVDTAMFLLRVKLPKGIPSVVKVYTKIYNTTSVLSYFLTNEWFFKDDNTVALYNSLSTTDKTLFNFDVKSIDWEDYIIIYGLGIRKYIIKDGLKNTHKAVKMQFWLKIANFIFFAVYGYFVLKILYTLFNTVQHMV